tara:strand:- start:196 stop:456 length:261 start_codon:yes stop_codon:yes gene_type:complete
MNDYIKKVEDKKLKKLKEENIEEFNRQKAIIEKSRKKNKLKSTEKFVVKLFLAFLCIITYNLNGAPILYLIYGITSMFIIRKINKV